MGSENSKEKDVGPVQPTMVAVKVVTKCTEDNHIETDEDKWLDCGNHNCKQNE